MEQGGFATFLGLVVQPTCWQAIAVGDSCLFQVREGRLQQAQGKLDLIIVDYLQLMSGGGRRYENRTQEVSAVSRGLKALAKEMRVPVVALSQLSRGSEQRTGDKKPLLSDLRESGSIEQDADVVAFIHREVPASDELTLAGAAR